MTHRIPCGFFLALVTLAMPSLVFAQTPSVSDTRNEPADIRAVTDVESAVDRGLDYLTRQQLPDGSWPSWRGNNSGVNALCLLAYLGRGHLLGRGPYQEAMGRAVRCILATQDEQGFFKSPGPSHGPMYEHGLATLALIEAYGSTPTPTFRARVQQAVDVILKSQSLDGGWRYQPRPGESDVSVTVMQVVALKAGQNARLRVPRETLEKALAYIKKCFNPEGAFNYQPNAVIDAEIAKATGWKFSPALTASGTLGLALLGNFDDPAFAAGVKFIDTMEYRPEMLYFYYTTYYAMQASFQAGGDHWTRWSTRTRTILLEKQNANGSWPGLAENSFNNGESLTYSTAFACISLNVFMHYLPAYQR